MSREFEDEAVLPNDIRDVMHEARSDLQEMQGGASLLVGEIVMPEPDERAVDLLRRAVRRDEHRYG